MVDIPIDRFALTGTLVTICCGRHTLNFWDAIQIWHTRINALRFCLEGNLVKATNQCRLENMKKLRELSFFLELSNIGDDFFHISLYLLLGLL